MERSRCKVVCLSLLHEQEAYGCVLALPGGELEYDIVPVEPNLAAIRDRIPELLDKYDAVALEGLNSTFKIGKQRYHHDYIWNYLELDAMGERFSDGTLLVSTLERYLVSQAAKILKESIKDKRILFFSGLNRYGSAEVLSSLTKHITFGDLLYGFRLGIPITSLRSFVASAPQIVRTVGQTPANWYWPSARRSRRVMPRYQFYFRQADVVVGGISYFRRYCPNSLKGRLIFTTLTTEADLELFRRKDADTVVSLTPSINGELVPLSVLEVGLRLTKPEVIDADEPEDYMLTQLHQMELTPAIYSLNEQPLPLEDTPADLPMQEMTIPREDAAHNIELSGESTVAKFCFVIHPLKFEQMKRLKIVRTMSKFLPERLIEDAAAQMAPWPVGKISNLVSASGAKAECLFYAVPMTSHCMMRFPPNFLYKKLQWIAEDAARRGCKIMGLGAYTSVVGDAGVTVSNSAPIGVTTGNSYTIAATIQTLEHAAQQSGIDLTNSHALVVGATGSIGTACARMLARRVTSLDIVSPRPEKLLSLSRQIETECPQLKGRIRLSRNAADFVGDADVIIATTSSVEPVIDVAALKPGCIVCDVARPPDISEKAAASRKDVLVIESGEIRLRDGAEMNLDIGLPPQTIYACLAETALLALDHRFGNFTLGRDIDLEKVDMISQLAVKHGFELAPIHSFGKSVPPERYTDIARARGLSVSDPRNIAV